MTTHSATRAHRRDAVPTGRDEVVAAILDSAATLFAERGPAAASIREIAARARVNHGLVFRHFGTKEDLIAAVLDHLASQHAELIDADAPVEQIQAASDRQLRVIARALLDGFPVGQLQTSFPGAARLLDAIRAQHRSGQAASLAAANAIALQVGWQLFEPFLRSATGLQDLTETELRRHIEAETERLLEPH
ncbi:MAG TPA: helix-turn-helix domain-containing protein [Mycobacterium sp.]|nr:helix-turn-helix domain-containing protein [Mycobacterium sp.]